MIKNFFLFFPDILVSGIPCLRQVLIVWFPDSLLVLVSSFVCLPVGRGASNLEFKQNYLPIIEGRKRQIFGNNVMMMTTATMARRKGMAPRKIVCMGTSFTTPARV